MRSASKGRVSRKNEVSLVVIASTIRWLQPGMLGRLAQLGDQLERGDGRQVLLAGQSGEPRGHEVLLAGLEDDRGAFVDELAHVGEVSVADRLMSWLRSS